MPGHPVVHFEINAPDTGPLKTFYSSLFGWHVESMPEMGYEMVDTHGGGGINGGIGKNEDQGPFVTFYVSADDLQAVLDKAESLGGKTVQPVMEIPNVVTLAMFADPLGNVIGLVQDDPAQEGPGVSAGSNPNVGWFEIMCSDAATLWTFYEQLFGWEISRSEGEGFVYGEVDTKTGKGISGGIGSAPNAPGQVTVYASVDDVAAYLAKATSLGGKAVMGPMNVNESLVVGLFADPQGAVFGLYHDSHQH